MSNRVPHTHGRHRAAVLLTAGLLLGLLAGCSDEDPVAPSGGGGENTVPQALTLDGAGDRVQDMGAAADYAFVSNTATSTIEALVRFADPSERKLQVIAANTFTRWDVGFLFGLENREGVGQRQLRFNVMDGTGNNLVSAYSAVDAITDDAWHHVAVVRSARGVAFYVDGVEVPGTAVSRVASDLAEPRRPLRLGDAYSEFEPASDFHLAGGLDEVRIWSVALNADRLIAGMAGPLPAAITEDPSSGLRGYWRFEKLEDLGAGAEGANDVRDHSPAGNHGDLAGDAALGESAAF